MKVLVVKGADFSANGIINVISYSWVMGASDAILKKASSGNKINSTDYCVLIFNVIGPKLVQKIKFRAESAGTINFKKYSNGSLSNTVATVTVSSGEVGTIVTKDLSNEVTLSDGEYLVIQTSDGCFRYKTGTSDAYRVQPPNGGIMTVSVYLDLYCANPIM